MIDGSLVRRQGAEGFDWLDELITRNPPLPPRLNRRGAQFVLAKIDEILAWEQRKETERHQVRGAGTLPLRSTGRTVLAAGRSEVVREVPAEEVSGIPEKGVLPDVDPRELAAAGEEELEKLGWAKGIELAKVARRDRQNFNYATDPAPKNWTT